MRNSLPSTRRDGAVLPLVTVCLVGLVGFVALAIDVGMMAVARTQAQSAADVAALAGARTLDGKSANNNRFNAEAEAVEAATSNSILADPITAAQVTLVDGRRVPVRHDHPAVQGRLPDRPDRAGGVRGHAGQDPRPARTRTSAGSSGSTR